ncbi:ribonuclease H-like domain-containing protein [Tanacetum coccineum]|uniref:Ribonuclease H-like domain-containing protein n=1 Tax=Tanacetum coccineum TaxID=301880 RepID=A0ABQ5GBA2_9ASTR
MSRMHFYMGTYLRPFTCINLPVFGTPHPDYVCLLQRSLYGLKQAPRAWFQRFAAYITRVGFHHSRCDSSLFIFHQGNDTAYLLLYVDDIVLTASSSDLLHRIISSLHQEFATTDLGSLNYFLGISVTRDSSGMFLSQKKYAVEILERAGMVHCNPSRTPVDTESKLGTTGDVVSDPTLYQSLAGNWGETVFVDEDDEKNIGKWKEFAMTDLGSLNYFLGISLTRDSSRMFLSQKKYVVEILECADMVHCNPSWTPVNTESKLGTTGDVVSDPTLYQSLASSLQYLTFTRPDISYVVQQVCLHMLDPREPPFSALKRILRYVCGTLEYGLQLFSSSTTDLVAYSDADWAGCPSTRRSISGYCVFLGNNLLSWSAMRQPTLSCSSAEAEYRGVANTVAETCCVVYLFSNPVQHQRMKHIEIDIHFVHDLVATGQVRVLHVPSHYQFADIFTKGLPTALFEEFRSSLNVRHPPAQTAGEC